MSDSASIHATAIVSILFSPSDIALTTATSSAQTVAGYDAFSILQPVYIFPESVISAAPTLKFDYGAYAFSAIFLAKSAKSLFFISTY